MPDFCDYAYERSHSDCLWDIECTKIQQGGNFVKRFISIATRHKGFCGAASFVLAVALILWTVNSPAIVGASAAVRELPIYNVQRDNKTVSLTFDAAWGNEDTQELIDILDTYGVKATFFLVGDWVDRYPESVRQLYDAGMEIANHSNTHPHMSKLSDKEIVNEVTLCNEKIEAITGEPVTLFRCPYGEYDDNVVSTINDMGIDVIQWNVDSLDWKDLSAEDIYSRVTQNVVPGSIVLFHNAALHTPEALPDIIEFLLAEGYEIVPVSEILLTGEYEINNAGMMVAKETA